MSIEHDFQPKPIPEHCEDLLERPLIMSIATVLADGTPQVTPVWFNYEDGHILFNSAKGRLKDRAIRNTPYVALNIVDPENPMHYLAIRGPVVEITEEGAVEHLNALAKRYLGENTYPFPADEVRVIYRIKPQHVLTFE